MKENTRKSYLDFLKIIACFAVIIMHLTVNNNYDPNVIKFVLNIKNITSNDSVKFLSLELDERICKTTKVS